MTRFRQEFQTVRSEGGLLPPDLLRRLIDPRSKLPGMRPEDYALAAGERLNEAVTQSWNRLRRHWTEFRAVAANLPAGEAGTGLTNDKWSLPLLRELGFGLLPATAGPTIAGRAYAVRRFAGPTPIHLVGRGLSLDRRAAGQRGAASANPHGLVQDLLNRSDAHLWAIVSNGLRLRILRDNSALSRQSWLEFDLDAMFSGEVYSDFVLLWLVAHATRFAPRDGGRPETCRLEDWTREAERQGARALGELRGSVERVLQVLGEGFTGHPKNVGLRDALRAGTVPLDEFHGQLLRVVYRLIFLFVAEDRRLDGEPLLHPRDDSAAARVARERYARHYGTARLRDLAGRIKGSRHGDLWRQFQLLVGALSGDPGFESVRRALALPALGSFLWSPDSTAALNDAALTNHDFLEALRRLAFIRQGKVLRPVDYRNLGAEELGGVYESLLGLTPQLNGGGARFTFAEFAGNARRTSGSYYTPDELVRCLLDTALDPVVEAAVRGKTGAEAEQAILDLKVCDPAVGSGHFLVGAAHRLARHLARVRAYSAGDGEPSPPLYQHALRDVIGRCLYGVDVNPMAAELCRVSLWLEALEPGKPLSFLDHHVRVGNSLLGATPALVEAGLPDEAFKPIQGDDRKVCSALRKRNRLERETGQRDMRRLLAAEPRAEYGSLAALRRDLDEAPDDTLDDVRRKEARFRGLVVSPKHRERQRVADAWCAAFVWPKRAGDESAPCVTTDALKDLHGDPDALTPGQRREVELLARRYRFFHWDLAFPEVFENGGFDCVLGNPPWERVKLQEKEWFAERRPEITDAPTAAMRKEMIQTLNTNDPVLYRWFLDALRDSAGHRHLISHSNRYPLCGRGDIDLYTVFAEAMRNFVNERGRVGCVLPTGIATDDTTKFFFQDLIRTKSLVSLFDFDNHRRRFFPDVRGDKKFCLFTVGRGARPAVADRADFIFFARAIQDMNDPERRFTLSPEDIALLNPNTLTCPIFRTRSDAELAKAIYRRVPVFVREDEAGRDPWNIRFNSMFHMANDSHLFRTQKELGAGDWRLVDNAFHNEEGGKYLPLYEGKMIHHFDHRWVSYAPNSNGGVFAEVSLPDKQDPLFSSTPRHWLNARDVYLRTADLPKELLTALRKDVASDIILGVARLLFSIWLRRNSGKSLQASMNRLFQHWIQFIECHPFALNLAPLQMGLCVDGPSSIQPLGPHYLPAVPVKDIESGLNSRTTWYAADGPQVSVYLRLADRYYAYVPDMLPPLHDETGVRAFAEDLLQRASPRWLMGCRDVTASTDERTIIGACFPLSAVGHNLPVWTISARLTAIFPGVLLSLLSSFVLDFVARLKVGGKHLTFFIAKQLPVLRPAMFSELAPWNGEDETIQGWLVPRILELTYTSWALQAFAKDCGYHGPPFRWDEERRFFLRCELDAAFFHLYLLADEQGGWRPARRSDGCPCDETAPELAELERHFPNPRDAVAYVLDTFPIVRYKDEQRFGDYRTKRVILEIYDAMREATAAGTSYRTPLDPAPADPACCHPPREIVRRPPTIAASLPDGAWAEPIVGDSTDHDPMDREIVVLAAVLTAVGGPEPTHRVRLAAVLAGAPWLLTPSLPASEEAEWRRLIGRDAEPLPPGVSRLPPPAYAWGAAVRQLRGSGDLLEDLDAKTWAPGPGLESIDTAGWPDGRAGFVLEVLRERGDTEISQTLRDAIQELIRAEAA